MTGGARSPSLPLIPANAGQFLRLRGQGCGELNHESHEDHEEEENWRRRRRDRTEGVASNLQSQRSSGAHLLRGLRGLWFQSFSNTAFDSGSRRSAGMSGVKKIALAQVLSRDRPAPDILIEPIVRAALAEDLGRAGDVTSAACIPDGARMTAAFVARKDGCIAGLDCARIAVRLLDPGARFEALVQDGADVSAGAVLARVEGDARALLAAERTALNLMQRLSGVATLTRAFVRAVAGTRAKIVDTRKTTPGLRALEKHAVRCGGGVNHRFGLDDAILIKDNHVAVCGGVAKAVERARAMHGWLMKVEVEVDTLEQFAEALRAGPDVILLDNFALDAMRKAVAMANGKVALEASGGVTLDTVRAIAETGVDSISVGALTHSAPALDIGLDA